MSGITNGCSLSLKKNLYKVTWSYGNTDILAEFFGFSFSGGERNRHFQMKEQEINADVGERNPFRVQLIMKESTV